MNSERKVTPNSESLFPVEIGKIKSESLKDILENGFEKPAEGSPPLFSIVREKEPSGKIVTIRILDARGIMFLDEKGQPLVLEREDPSNEDSSFLLPIRFVPIIEKINKAYGQHVLGVENQLAEVINKNLTSEDCHLIPKSLPPRERVPDNIKIDLRNGNITSQKTIPYILVDMKTGQTLADIPLRIKAASLLDSESQHYNLFDAIGVNSRFWQETLERKEENKISPEDIIYHNKDKGVTSLLPSTAVLMPLNELKQIMETFIAEKHPPSTFDFLGKNKKGLAIMDAFNRGLRQYASIDSVVNVENFLTSKVDDKPSIKEAVEHNKYMLVSLSTAYPDLLKYIERSQIKKESSSTLTHP